MTCWHSTPRAKICYTILQLCMPHETIHKLQLATTFLCIGPIQKYPSYSGKDLLPWLPYMGIHVFMQKLLLSHHAWLAALHNRTTPRRGLIYR
jgi:hypothetical protein